MDTKKVLLLVRDFPPYYHSLGGVIRIVKLGDFLCSHGFQVHVVASAGEPVDYFGYENVVKNFDVHYVSDPYQRIYNRRALSRRRNRPNSTPSRNRRQMIRQFATELAVPDLAVFFAHGLYRRALEVVTDHAIPNIIVSSPPFSTQIAGLMLKRKLRENIKLIVDYRDSWNTISIFAKRWALTRFASRSLERKVLSTADCLLYQSPPVIEKVNQMFPGCVRCSELVMNGFDPAMELPKEQPEPNNPMLTIGHFGAIKDDPHGFRDPTMLLETMSELDLPIRFMFYGDADFARRWQDSLSDRFVIRGNLSHADALYEMSQMDALMVVHSDPVGADEVIPAKIFEYMLTGRPIFVVGPPNMEAARIVSENGLGYTANIFDKIDIRAILTGIYKEWKNNAMIRYDGPRLDQFSRTVQYEKILPLLS